MSLLEKSISYPPDSIFDLSARFKRDERDDKMDLIIGVYRDEDLKTRVMGCVTEAEKKLLASEVNKGYLPIAGDAGFLEASFKLLLGKKSTRCVGLQTVGGTSALRLGGELLLESGNKKLYFSNLTWANHRKIFTTCGLDVGVYPYFNLEKQQVETGVFFDFLKKLPEKSVVLLHGCCHNPTGSDLSQEEWKALSKLCFEKKLIPFFDFAYQGFGSGIEEDAWAVRYFADQGHEMLVARSYSKTFGLYGERVGDLSYFAGEAASGEKALSVLKHHARASYSNPPRHGALIISTILNDPGLKQMWVGELNQMRQRITEMRELLATKLRDQLGDNRFDYILHQKGLFSLLGLSEGQTARVISEFGIYLPSKGRVNMTGLNQGNIDRFVDAINAVIT